MPPSFKSTNGEAVEPHQHEEVESLLNTTTVTNDLDEKPMPETKTHILLKKNEEGGKEEDARLKVKPATNIIVAQPPRATDAIIPSEQNEGKEEEKEEDDHLQANSVSKARRRAAISFDHRSCRSSCV